MSELDSIFAISRDLFSLVDPDGRIRRASPTLAEVLGVAPDALVGRSIVEIVEVESRELFASRLRELRKGEATDRAVTAALSGRPERTFEWNLLGDPSEGLVVIMGRDVTGRLEDDRARRRLRSALTQSPLGLLVSDEHGRVRFANPRFRNLARAEDALDGRPLPDALHGLVLPDDLRDDLARDEVAVTWQGEVPVRGTEGSGGTERWIRVSVSPIRQAEEQLLGHMVSLEDATERRRANEALVRTARAKDEFLATMSHELRTPLNAVITITESLTEGIYGELSEDQMDALGTVEESGRHLLSLINDILDVAKIEAGEMRLQPTRVNVRDICEASLRLVAETAAQKGHTLSLEVDPEVESVRADDRRLKQILVNLLGNAVKFTPSGGSVTLRVEMGPDGDSLRFQVEDDGVGIDPAEQEFLLRPFVQGEGTLDRSHEGTGLGLTLVLRLAQLHGGELAIESEGAGQGSRFTVTLPWRGESGTDAEPLTAASLPVERAFLVEDSAVTSDHMMRYLEEFGIETRLNETGAGVPDEVAEFEPDVVLLDLLLPGTSGWTVLEELRSDPRTREVPVIMATVVDATERSRKADVAAHLVKPVSRAELAAALGSLRRSSGSCMGVDGDGAAERTTHRVLLAEDNPANVKALLPILEARGLQVTVVGNGRDALEHIEEHRPSLVLMDVQMPEMGGLEATRALREREDGKPSRTPVVALTALAMPGDQERCLAAGADAYLSKPLSVKALDALLREYLEGSGP